MGKKNSVNDLLSKMYPQEKAGSSSTRSRRPPSRYRREEGGEDEGRRGRVQREEVAPSERGRGRTRTVQELVASDQVASSERVRRRRRLASSRREAPSVSGTATFEEDSVGGDRREDEELQFFETQQQSEEGEEEQQQSEHGEEEEQHQSEQGEEEEQHEEGGDDEARRPKPLWVRGEACLPKEPKTEADKIRLKPTNKNFVFVGPKGRLPGGILTILLKLHWPGVYKQRDGSTKLATTWEDYAVAPCSTFRDDEGHVMTCAQVVIRRFWDFYALALEEDLKKSNKLLWAMARKNVRAFIHDARSLAISHFYAEAEGVRKNKSHIVEENLEIDVEDLLSIHPNWCDNKRDGWEELVNLWTSDEEFKAKSIQNKANRGREGTHNQGNRHFESYKKHVEASNGGQELPEVDVWKRAHRKKVVETGKDPYYGKTTQDLMDYTREFKNKHGPDSDPLSEPFDNDPYYGKIHSTLFPFLVVINWVTLTLS